MGTPKPPTESQQSSASPFLGCSGELETKSCFRRWDDTMNSLCSVPLL